MKKADDTDETEQKTNDETTIEDAPKKVDETKPDESSPSKDIKDGEGEGEGETKPQEPKMDEVKKPEELPKKEEKP